MAVNIKIGQYDMKDLTSSGNAFVSHAGDRGSISDWDRSKSFKKLVTAPLSNARQQV